MKYHVKINDIIRYMDANNLVHMKDKIIYYTSFEKINDIIWYMDANNLAHMKDKLIYYASYERPWIVVQTKFHRTSISWTIWEILALVSGKWEVSSKNKQ